METLKHPNAWDFDDKNSNELDNKNNAYIEYSTLNEIGMGAPIGGACYLVKKGLNKKLINEWCGGPAIWNSFGVKVAIPIWDRTFFKGVFQRIGIVDTEKLTLTIFNRKFRVLDLRTFNDYMIKGFDSPVYKTKVVEFDIKNEKIKHIISLK